MPEFLNRGTMTQRLVEKFQGETPNRISQWLQHWTNINLLAPEKETLHQGSGIHRLYPLEQLYIAAILCELTPYSFQVKVLKGIADCLRAEQKRKGMLKKAAQGEEWYFLFWMSRFIDTVFGVTTQDLEYITGKDWEPLYRTSTGPKKGEYVCLGNIHIVRLDYILKGL